MDIVNFPSEHRSVGARGDCPHCSARSYMRPVGGAFVEPNEGGRGNMIANPTQCESCKKFLLVVGKRDLGNAPYELVEVYPLAMPNDHVDEAVPEQIASDFREALRCHWARAYRATVAMCGRAIQASALEKGASPDRKLVQQIDELAEKGIITQPLREMAHEVRLTRNIGAHPGEDGLVGVSQKDADDIIEFTREFFHHVYVMPAKLESRRKKKQDEA